MLYLIQQIVLCLLFTALIGVAVGWLLRGMGSSRQSDMVAAQWRAKVEDIESRHETAVSTAAEPAAPGGAQFEALRQRLAERERELATLRTAQAVRTQTDGDTSREELREELRETRIVCQQLQGRMSEQRTLNERLEGRLQMAAAERTTLVERLRDLETRYAELTRERQHAVDTVAGLQKELRARTAADQKGATAQTPQAPQPEREPDAAAARTVQAVEAAGTAAARRESKTGQQGASARKPRPVQPAKAPASVPAHTAGAVKTAGTAAARRESKTGQQGASARKPRPVQPAKAPASVPAHTAGAAKTAGVRRDGKTAPQDASAPQPRPVQPKKTPAEPRVRQGGDAGQQSLPIADTTSTPATPKPYEPAWRLRAADGAPDNLQAIYGVGPKLEQRLNELGIFHFRQIAAFEKPDILWLARHLQSFPGRILRDRWVEQARSLEKRRRAGQPI